MNFVERRPILDKYSRIISQFIESINLFNELEKKPRKYGTNHVLYNSEIDTLMLIGKGDDINLTELAKSLGISKSGTTRFVKKLIEKELIIKSKKKNNAKEVVFNLTGEGKTAFRERLKFNKETYATLHGNVVRYVDDDLHRISEFLETTNEEMRKLL